MLAHPSTLLLKATLKCFECSFMLAHASQKDYSGVFERSQTSKIETFARIAKAVNSFPQKLYLRCSTGFLMHLWIVTFSK